MLRFVIEFMVTIALLGAIPGLMRTTVELLKKGAGSLNDGLRAMFKLDKEEKKEENPMN